MRQASSPAYTPCEPRCSRGQKQKQRHKGRDRDEYGNRDRIGRGRHRRQRGEKRRETHRATDRDGETGRARQRRREARETKATSSGDGPLYDNCFPSSCVWCGVEESESHTLCTVVPHSLLWCALPFAPQCALLRVCNVFCPISPHSLQCGHRTSGMTWLFSARCLKKSSASAPSGSCAEAMAAIAPDCTAPVSYSRPLSV